MYRISGTTAAHGVGLESASRRVTHLFPTCRFSANAASDE